jgi:hypothetical protein
VSTVWEDAWDVLNASFLALAEQLAADLPGLRWSCGHHDNESFPFRAYAAFAVDGDDDDVVVSVDFRHIHEALAYSADVARDDGEVLAEGPAGTIPRTADGVPPRTGIEAAVRSVARFVDESGSVVRSGIRARG